MIANKRVAHSIGLSHAFIFASGALLTASLLHIIPEAIEVRGGSDGQDWQSIFLIFFCFWPIFLVIVFVHQLLPRILFAEQFKFRVEGSSGSPLLPFLPAGRHSMQVCFACSPDPAGSPPADTSRLDSPRPVDTIRRSWSVGYLCRNLHELNHSLREPNRTEPNRNDTKMRQGLAPEYENELHEMGLNAMLSLLGGISLGMLIHALLDSGSRTHDHSPGGDRHHHHHDHDMAAGGGAGAAVSGLDTLMASGALRSDRNAAVKPTAPVSGNSLDGGLSLDGVPVMVDGGPLDVTQPPTPCEPSSGTLRSLIASREGRDLLDVKGLQPVCWNVVAGDLVRAVRCGGDGDWGGGVQASSLAGDVVLLPGGCHFSMSCSLYLSSHLAKPSLLVNSPEPATYFPRAWLSSSVALAVLSHVLTKNQVHNFADGVTIGAAFLSCSTAIGWTVTASAILHEIPHELADFMALLNGGMSVKQVRTAAVPCFDLLRAHFVPLLVFMLELL